MSPFHQIPANIRVPLFYAEVDNSQANTAQTTQRALITAQITADGTAPPNVPAISQGSDDAITAGGVGSMLAAYRANDAFGEVWYLPLADASGATAATGQLTIETPPTAAGTLYLYIAGVHIAQPVQPTQSASDIATAPVATIGQTRGIPATVSASSGTVNLTARNDQHASTMGFNDSPTPAWIWAASLAGASAVSLRADPATPLQTLPLIGVLAPPVQSRFALSDRNSLLYDGIATFTVGDDGTVAIENLISTYQKNAFGQPGDSYLEVETLFTLSTVLRHLRAVITSKYARAKLADDGTRFASGSNVVTSNIIRADLIATCQTDEENGLVQDSDVFAKGLIVVRNAGNPNRVGLLRKRCIRAPHCRPVAFGP